MGVFADYVASAIEKVLIYIDKYRTGWINVKSYGAKGDGVTDDTEAIEKCLEEVDRGAIVYFPKGVYCVSKPFILNKNIQLYGDTKMSEIHKPGELGRVIYPESVIKWVGEANNTIFTVGETAYRTDFCNLAFIADSYVVNETGNVATDGNPAKYYEADTLLENVSAIDTSGCSGDKTINNCAFYGFSGIALTVGQHKYIKDCSFAHCNIGVKCTNYDNILKTCWWCKCSIGIYSDTMTNIFVHGSWFDQMEQHAVKSDKQLMLHFEGGCQVDMCDYCAIYVPKATLLQSRISGRFSRCGMYYAGTSDITTIEKEERYKAVCIYAYISNSSYFEVTTHKRAIATGLGSCPVCIFEGNSGYSYCNVIDTSEANYLGREFLFKRSTIIRGKERIVGNASGVFTSVPTIIYRPSTLPTSGNAFTSSNEGDMFYYGAKNDLYISTLAGSKDDWVKITTHGDGDTITETDGVLSLSEDVLSRISELETKIAELTATSEVTTE